MFNMTGDCAGIPDTIPLAGTAHKQVLDGAKAIVKGRGKNSFTIKEVLDLLDRSGTGYTEATIRTHISSRCCRDAPNHHADTYPYFERKGGGRLVVAGGKVYRLTEKHNPLN